MEVEFTARQGKISKALRAQATEGLDRLAQVLGKTAHATVVFSTQRHLQVVEVTLTSRAKKIAATGKGATQEAALREALAHAEHQARRYRDRKLATKRLPKEEKVMTAPPVARPKTRTAESATAEGKAAKAAAKPRASIAVHSFPAGKQVVEPHIIQNGEAIALKPLTIEQAVKEAEFRDRDLLIFRNTTGTLFVLHRRRDGQMELVEIP